MARAVNWIYAVILVILSIDSLWLGFFPAEFLPYAVILMGVAILMTKIENPTGPRGMGGIGRVSAWSNISRRFFFGIVLIFIGVASTGLLGDWGALLVVGTLGGSLVLLAISVIYVLSLFKKTRQMQVASY